MREQDIINKEYFADNERVADLINVFLFQGKQRIRAEDISEEDSAASGSVERFGKNVVKQKYRDLFRRITMGVCFAFVGIEEQGVVHFAMPVRAMGYDFLSYDKQVKQLQRKNKLLNRADSREAFLSGLNINDRIAPVVTIILYYGEKPWDGPRSLWEMLSMEEIPSEFRVFVNDYPLHILEVKRLKNVNQFRTDLRLVFGFLQKQGSREGIKEFLEENREELENLREDAYDMMTVMGHAEQLTEMKEKYREGEMVDMCRGLDELLEERRQEGIQEGLEKGMEKGMKKGMKKGRREGKREGKEEIFVDMIQKKHKKNKPLSVIADELEETEASIKPIYYLVVKYPEKDAEEILRMLRKASQSKV